MSSVAVALNAISSTYDGRPPPLMIERIGNFNCATVLHDGHWGIGPLIGYECYEADA